MSMLGTHHRESRLLVPTTPSVRWLPGAQLFSTARARCAAAQTAAPLPPARHCAVGSLATDGSAGNQKQRSFFVLRKTKPRL